MPCMSSRQTTSVNQSDIGHYGGLSVTRLFSFHFNCMHPQALFPPPPLQTINIISLSSSSLLSSSHRRRRHVKSNCMIESLDVDDGLVSCNTATRRRWWRWTRPRSPWRSRRSERAARPLASWGLRIWCLSPVGVKEGEGGAFEEVGTLEGMRGCDRCTGLVILTWYERGWGGCVGGRGEMVYKRGELGALGGCLWPSPICVLTWSWCSSKWCVSLYGGTRIERIYWKDVMIVCWCGSQAVSPCVGYLEESPQWPSGLPHTAWWCTSTCQWTSLADTCSRTWRRRSGTRSLRWSYRPCPWSPSDPQTTTPCPPAARSPASCLGRRESLWCGSSDERCVVTVC